MIKVYLSVLQVSVWITIFDYWHIQKKNRLSLAFIKSTADLYYKWQKLLGFYINIKSSGLKETLQSLGWHSVYNQVKAVFCTSQKWQILHKQAKNVQLCCWLEDIQEELVN